MLQFFVSIILFLDLSFAALLDLRDDTKNKKQ